MADHHLVLDLVRGRGPRPADLALVDDRLHPAIIAPASDRCQVYVAGATITVRRLMVPMPPACRCSSRTL